MSHVGGADGDRITRAALLRRGAGLAAGATALAATGRLHAATRPPLSELEAATSGPVLRPGSAAYTAARRVVNARYDGARPLAVLKARDAADVRAAVRWSARHGVRITARSGGHSYAGYSTVDGGLVVDLSRLNGIAVSADRRTVQVGAGAHLIDVYTALARHGLTVPGGSCPTVGVGGLALGGGIGLASRALGATCDNIESLTLVTADGRARHCDRNREGDLYWASRGGGGGNFGIATGFTFRTHRVSSASYFFASFPWSRAAEVVRAWQAWAPVAPDDLFSICSLSTGSSGPVISAFGQWMGDQAGLRRALRPFTTATDPTRLTVGTSTYLDMMLRWAGCLGDSPAECRRMPSDLFAAGSAYARAPLPAAGARAIVAAILRRQAESAHGSGAILLDSYGGAINRIPADATAFVHRDARFSLQYLAYWGRPADAARGVAWVRSARRAVRPFISGQAYQNYIDPTLENWPAAYYGANLPRLRDVKRRSDPDRVFRFPQGIRG
ncbi:MAG TPA: FAD-binding oxidoreductase [Miltoncostaea sp.]|nr:FAD-binding oxidoreductase [Miltoncostaea sp.]